jgi:hypothetical protein
MAIKGKGKARGRRAVAAPPRPTLVVRKPPIWRRRWVWAALGGIAVAAILAIVLVKLHDSHARAVKTRERTALSEFFTALERRFPPDRQLIPPDVPNFYPNLSQDLTNLAQAKVKPADALAEAQGVSATARKAAADVRAIDLKRFFPRSFTLTADRQVTGRGGTFETMQDAQFLMSQGFTLYGVAGDLMKQAASVTGSARGALVQQAQTMLSTASSVFDRGYRRFLLLRQFVGLKSPNPASGVKPGRPLPTIAPSPSPSPKAKGKGNRSPSPSPSASASP